MIISASRRTDIPAFFSKGFMSLAKGLAFAGVYSAKADDKN